MLIHGGSGATTVDARAANVTLTGGSGALDYVGGSGFSMVNFGSGAARVHTGSGNGLFIFDAAKATKSMTFSDFALGKDFINCHDFSGHPTSSFAWARQTEMIALGDGTSIAVNFAAQ